MDFGALLHTAQKNGQNGKKETRYYSTKFAPPKKEQRNKSLSVNIKNFLAKKEAEEAQKAEADKRKRDELLALRAQDKKATRRVNVMLKRTKSANQSVIQDAVDKDNTAVTLAGPSQPDEDDYGYVSQEAAAFYNKMMEKYSKMPDEPKFSLEKKKKSSANLNQLKNKVIAALDREQEEANMPHKRRRKRKEDGTGNDHDGEVYEESRREETAPIKASKPRAAAPPPLNFAELLKIAEKKQFEPIVIEPKEKKDEERPLTKKQKKELEREREWRERKEGKAPPNRPQDKPTAPPAKIPKLNGAPPKLNSASSTDIKPTKTPTDSDRILKENGAKPKPGDINGKVASDVLNRHKIHVKQQQPSGISERAKGDFLKQALTKKPMKAPERPIQVPRSSQSSSSKGIVQKPEKKPLPVKKFPPDDVRPPRQDLKPKTKQFPPPDVRRRPPPPPGGFKRKPVKRRILDDDEDYDSEMDDFIDDGPDESEDYSKYISEIFGYDKSKYRCAEDDDDNMESSFSQQLKEEYISTKIGIMEDLEDIRKEEEEKKRKALMKKKLK